MQLPPQHPAEPRASYTFDAIPEDDERQEELNRIMRKPGEPPYSQHTEKPETDTSESDDTEPAG